MKKCDSSALVSSLGCLVVVVLFSIATSVGQMKPTASKASGGGVLLVDTDDSCRLVLDGEDKGLIKPDQAIQISVSLGEHMLKCSVEGTPDLAWRKVVEVKTSEQVVALISLKAQHTQYEEATTKPEKNKGSRAAPVRNLQAPVSAPEGTGIPGYESALETRTVQVYVAEHRSQEALELLKKYGHTFMLSGPNTDLLRDLGATQDLIDQIKTTSPTSSNHDIQRDRQDLTSEEKKVRDLLSDDPGNAGLHIVLGNILGHQIPCMADADRSRCFRTNSKAVEMIAEYRKAIQLKPGASYAHFFLAATFGDASEERSETIAEFKEAIRLKPDEPEYHGWLGMRYRIANNEPDAEKEFALQQQLTNTIDKLHPEDHVGQVQIAWGSTVSFYLLSDAKVGSASFPQNTEMKVKMRYPVDTLHFIGADKFDGLLVSPLVSRGGVVVNAGAEVRGSYGTVAASQHSAPAARTLVVKELIDDDKTYSILASVRSPSADLRSDVNIDTTHPFATADPAPALQFETVATYVAGHKNQEVTDLLQRRGSFSSWLTGPYLDLLQDLAATKELMVAIRVAPYDANTRDRQRDNQDLSAEEKELRSLLRPDPLNAPRQALLGLILARQQRYAEAVKAYRKSIEIKPSVSYAHFWLGTSLIEGLSKLQEGMAEIQEAMRLKPNEPAYHSWLGGISANKKDWNAAASEYQRTLELDPYDTMREGNLATVRMLMKSSAQPASPPTGQNK